MIASTPPGSGRIFISYRREEASYPAGWLFHQLADHFGGDQVFRDVVSIHPGDDFVDAITAAVGSCEVLLAVIGRRWLTGTDEHGRRRLDDPGDYVRLEIETALTREVRVIPILLDGARMPGADELPPSLARLARRQALELNPSRFDDDTGKLLVVLEQALTGVTAPSAESRQAAAPMPSVVEASPANEGTAAVLPPRVVGERVSTAVEVFRDRIEFRARLRALVLAREKPIICITGRRGIGKSGLVAKVLAEFEEPGSSSGDEVGGLVYVSTRTGVGMLDLGRVFHALSGLLPQDQRNQVEEEWANVKTEALNDLFTAFQDRNVVIVLDNLDDLQDPDSGQLVGDGPLAFLTAVCKHRRPPLVITTSQRPLGLPPMIGVRTSRVDIEEGLDAEDAVELLRQLDVDGEAGLRELPDQELRQAVALVHGAPRGLELLAALLVERRTETLQRILGAQDTPEVVLGRLVSEGFQSLDAVGQDVLRLLSLADTPLPIQALSGMLEGRHPASAVAQTVGRLVNRRVIGFDRPKRTARLHPIDSDYVRQTFFGDPKQRAVLDLRLADWLATQRTDRWSWRTSTDVAPQRREIRHRLRAGDGHGAIGVIADIAEFLAGRGESDLLTGSLSQASRYADTPPARAAYELSRGMAEFFTGSLDEAVAAFRAGRQAGWQAGDRFMTARLNLLLGNALRHLGDPAAAREPLTEAATLPPVDRPSREIVLGSLADLGLVACYLGDANTAEDAAARIAATLRPDDPSLWWAWLADLRALAALLNRDYTAALAEVERGIERYADSPDQASGGYLINVRGLVFLAQGRTIEAAQEFAAAQRDAAAIHQARLEGFAALNLAWTYLVQGDRGVAAATAQEAGERLAANRVREAESAVALTAACQAKNAEDRLAELRHAVQGSNGNPDLYQPSDETMTSLAQNGIDPGQ